MTSCAAHRCWLMTLLLGLLLPALVGCTVVTAALSAVGLIPAHAQEPAMDAAREVDQAAFGWLQAVIFGSAGVAGGALAERGRQRLKSRRERRKAEDEIVRSASR